MGLRLFSGSSSSSSAVSGPMVPASWRSGGDRRSPIEPDPKKFNVLKAVEHRDFVIMEIRYPNCVNYEGHKILVFKGHSVDELSKLEEIDPHFLEKGICPIARFEPTEIGWKMACSCVENFKEQTDGLD